MHSDTIAVDTSPRIEKASEAVRDAYLPNPDRSGIGLCLSGGGFRASLFHLGALRRLNEVGVLSRIRTVSCVSGGSILGAHLAQRVAVWPTPGEPVPDFVGAVVRPFEAIARMNLRTAPLVRRFLVPWNVPRSQTQIAALANLFERHLNQGLLRDLPPAGPQFVFCASDNAFGVNWIFSRERVGDYQAGYMTPPAGWNVAQAVAASSCFPPLFDPMRLELDPQALTGGQYPRGERRDTLIGGLRLSDGGLYDNLALEPVWKDHAVVIVSDGGSTLDPSADTGLLWRVKRYATVMGRQATAVRKRWLIAGYLKDVFEGVYLGIGTPVSRYPTGGSGYPAELVEETISEVRTDLDSFSDAEIAVLQNHGYLVAEAGLQSYLRETPIGLISAPLNVPYERFLDPELVRAELADSHKVKLPLGRGNWARELF